MAELTAYLNKAGITYRERGTNVARDNINICCVFCGESRFHLGIQRDKLWGRCWVCGDGGPWGRIARQLAKTYPSIAWRDLQPSGQEYYIDDGAAPRESRLNKPLNSLYKPLQDTDEDIWEWLTTVPSLADLKWADRPRGVPKDILQDAGIQLGIGKLNGYVVFDQNGSINARRYSSDVPGSRWWKQLNEKPFVYGAQWCYKVQPDLGVITEGIFDTLRAPIGQAVGILGSVVSESLVEKLAQIFVTTKVLVTALDKDADEKQGGKLRMMLSDIGYEVRNVDWSKVPDQDVKDLDELYIARGEEYLFNFLGLKSMDVLL